MEEQFVPYRVPADVDKRILEHRERMAAAQGVPVTKVSKSGDVLRRWAAIVELAEQLGIDTTATIAQA